MRVKFVKAQNTKMPEDKLFPLLGQMSIVAVKGQAVFPNQAVPVVRNYLLHNDYVEGQHFVMYNNSLFVLRSLVNKQLSNIIAEVVYGVLPANIGYHGPQETGVEKIKQGKIQMPVWKLLAIPSNFDLSDYVDEFDEFLKNHGYRKEIDYKIHFNKIYLNSAIQGYKDEEGNDWDQTFVQLLIDVNAFLHFKGIIPNDKSVRILHTYSPIHNYELVSWLAFDLTANSDVKVLSQIMQSLGFSGEDFVIHGDHGILVNRVSLRYNAMIETIVDYMKSIGKEMPSPESDGLEKNVDRDWRAIEFENRDKGGINIDSLVFDLTERFFKEHDDFMTISGTMFINIRSRRFTTLEKLLLTFASDELFGISKFSINYNVGRKQSSDIIDHWGTDIPQKFYFSGYVNRTYDYLFRFRAADSREQRLLKIHYSEACIAALLASNISDFYATYSGAVLCASGQAELMAKNADSFNSELAKALDKLKTMKTEKEKLSFLKAKLGPEEFGKIIPEVEEQKSSIRGFWNSSINPFRQLLTPSNEDLDKMEKVLEKMEQDESFLFSDLSELAKIGRVRRIVMEIGILPGYENREMAPEIISSNFDYFSELAASRRIKVDDKIKSLGEESYEYILSKNNWNCPRVNAFLEEFRFNVFLKEDMPPASNQRAFSIAVESSFNFIIDRMRDNTIFAPIPGDVQKTKMREQRYNRFVNEVFKAGGVVDKVEEKTLAFYNKTKIDMSQFNNMVSFRLSPIYKEISKIINTEIARGVSMTSLVQGKPQVS